MAITIDVTAEDIQTWAERDRTKYLFNIAYHCAVVKATQRATGIYAVFCGYTEINISDKSYVLPGIANKIEAMDKGQVIPPFSFVIADY